MLRTLKHRAVDSAFRKVRHIMRKQFVPGVAEDLAGAFVHGHESASLVVHADRHVGGVDRLEEQRFEDDAPGVKARHTSDILMPAWFSGKRAKAAPEDW
jgi:hypothetical protein